jgi:hypothetical protein
MTEEDWFTTTNPYDITHHKHSRDDRKRRLMACACLRRVFGSTLDHQLLTLVGAAEEYADGMVSSSELVALRKSVRKHFHAHDVSEHEKFQLQYHTTKAALMVSEKEFMNFKMALEQCQFAQGSLDRSLWDLSIEAERRAQRQIGREIFQNPYRPITFNSSWRTSTAVALAESIYTDRAFDRLPILADALEDAGCDAAELLAHFRGPELHVRGCWALDLVLGKG